MMRLYVLVPDWPIPFLEVESANLADVPMNPLRLQRELAASLDACMPPQFLTFDPGCYLFLGLGRLSLALDRILSRQQVRVEINEPFRVRSNVGVGDGYGGPVVAAAQYCSHL